MSSEYTVGLGQDLGHVVLRDAPGQALGNRGLAHAGLAHQQRVVLAAAAQDLDGALDLVVAPDQRVDLAVLGQLVQVLVNCSSGEAFSLRSPPSSLSAGLAFAALGWLGRLALLDAVGDEVDHVQARDALLVQVVHGVRVFLAKDGDQHVGAGDFLLAIAGGLHVHDGALDDALEAQRGLGVHLVGARHLGRVVLDEVGQRLAQVVDVGRTGAQHLGGAGVVQQRKQQMLHGDELVALLPGLDKGHVQADFQFLGNHVNFLCACLRSISEQRSTGGDRDQRLWPLFNRFTDTLQRVPACARRLQHLVHLGGGHIAGIDAADAFAVQVDLQHDLGRGSRSLPKNSWITTTTNSMGV
jgi:hypothetical protein